MFEVLTWLDQESYKSISTKIMQDKKFHNDQTEPN